MAVASLCCKRLLGQIRTLGEISVSRHFRPTKALPLPRATFSTEVKPDIKENRADLVLSDSCVRKLKKISNGQTFLRVLVDGGGCAGFEYKFKLDSKVNDDDLVFERDGVKAVVDSASLEFMRGSVLDYQEELIRSSFCISANPKAIHGCSCGTSFTVKLD